MMIKKKITWKHSINKYEKNFTHIWETHFYLRFKNNSNCPFCTNRELQIGFNDFETWCKENDRQDLLNEWDYNLNETLPNEPKFRFFLLLKSLIFKLLIC